MVGSFLATKWPILIRFCWIVHQKSKFSLISDTSSVGGCWGQPILFFWKLVDETQMVKPPEPTIHHNSKKYLILLPLRAIYFRSFHYETPCIFGWLCNFVRQKWDHTWGVYCILFIKSWRLGMANKLVDIIRSKDFCSGILFAKSLWSTVRKNVLMIEKK